MALGRPKKKANRQSINLLPHQHELVRDTTTRFLGLVAGYGSGKTRAACVKALSLAQLNKGYTGCILEPTLTMCRGILVPEMEKLFSELGWVQDVHYQRWQSPGIKYIINWDDGLQSTILMMSSENYKRLMGLSLAWFISDEADLGTLSHNELVFQALSSRIRVGNVIQGVFTSTPEGHKFMYKFFEKEAGDDRRLIRARTYDNPFLDADFIPSLRRTYDPQKLEAYLNGEFVNLNTATVYYCYQREKNGTSLTLSDFPKNSVLHIGMDFNVGKMSAAVSVVKDQISYTVDEIVKVRDTASMCREIARRYPARHIIVYPDASGSSENTKTAWTDIDIIQKAGFSVKMHAKNPLIADRVNSVNARLLVETEIDGTLREERRAFINETRCPTLVEGLEAQTWEKKGEKQFPDTDNDYNHVIDAFGYFIFYHWPSYGRQKAVVVN